MKQKLFTLFLALVASVSAIYASDTRVGDIWYDFDRSTKTASVTYRGSYYGSYNGEYSGSVVIPSSVTYNGTTYNVTSIGYRAFYDCSSLTSVTIPNSVTSIGDGAFDGCSSISSPVYNAHCFAYMPTSYSGAYTIPEGIKQIAGGAFRDCSSLTSVTIPESVTSIGRSAFSGCSSLTSVTIGESVTSIGEWAFSSCSALTSVTIGDGVTSIGERAFNGCSSLTSVTIGESVTSIGNYAFDGCSSLTSVTIPEGVTSIGEWAFSSCSALTSITCEAATPPTVGQFAFDGVSKSIPVYVPCGCVGAYKAANGWEKFTNIQEPLAEYSLTVDVNDNIMGTAKVDINNACGSQISATPNFGYHFVQWSDGSTDTIRTLELTQDTILIAEFAQSFSGQCGDSLYWEFVDTTLHITGKGEMYYYKPDSAPWKLLVSSIKVLTIAEDVTMIGYDAFDGCIALVTIVWNAKHAADAYNDGQYNYPVFYGICSQITSFNLGENVEYIPSHLCSGMENLTSVTIPESVTSIGTCAFQDCSSLTSVTIPNSVTSIGDYAFNSCTSLTSVTIPESVTSIGYAAFAYCSSLASVTIPESVTSIGDYAFNSCTSLTSVTIPESVTSIGYAAFAYCSSLASVTIPESVTSIGKSAFWGCRSLTSITIPNSVTSIGDDAFHICNNITSVTWNAKNCNTYNFGSQVTSFEFGNEVEVVPSSLCKGMEKLTSVTIPNSVTSIGTCAFRDCSSLTSVTISNSVTSIGDGAFKDCSSLTSVTIPNSVKTIGTSAFEGCARLGKISLGTGLEEIAANAFAGCTRLYDIYVYATYPPFAEESSFANYNVYVYVPCEYQRGYTLDVVWGKFKFIECIESEDATTDGNVTVVPGFNDVTITWPTAENADSYSLVIKKADEPVCTLIFNQEGQLLNIAFAPGRDGNNHPAQYAAQTVSGYRFTVTGLTEATQYAYNITTKDAANNTIATYSGEFTTMGGTTTAVEDILQNTTNTQKILRNGQLIIIRDGVEYNAMGQEL